MKRWYTVYHNMSGKILPSHGMFGRAPVVEHIRSRAEGLAKLSQVRPLYIFAVDDETGEIVGGQVVEG